MSISYSEQETVIGFSRDEDIAHIYTSDTTMMTKFDKLARTSEHWNEVKTTTCDGELVGKFYECPKKLLSYRGTTRTGREMSEEERRAAAERLKNARERKAKNTRGDQ